MILAIAALLASAANATITIHACLVYNKRGRRANSFLPKVLPLFTDHLTANGNQLAGKDVNIIWHQADMNSDGDRILLMGPQLVAGTWVDDYWSTVSTEPAMAPCQVFFVNSDSGSMAKFLKGLKDANLRVPTYSSGASSDTLWKNADYTGGVYDFVKTANGPGFAQLSETNLVRLHQLGAKTVVFLYADMLAANPWATGVKTFTLNLIKELGMKIVAEGEVYFDKCSIKPDPAACKEKVFTSIDKVLTAAGIEFGTGEIQADVYFGLHPHAFGCPEEIEYLYRRDLNFGALLMHLCYAYPKPDGSDIPDYIYDWTYSGMGGHQNVKGPSFDEGTYALTDYPQMFASAGEKSAKAFEQLMVAKYGEGFWHYQYFWAFASFYNFWIDFAKADGVVANMINSFGKRTAPVVSYYGFLGSDEGGSNPYHNFLGAQLVPDDSVGTGRKVNIVAPKSIASDEPVFPMPRWDQRECWPNCVQCPNCVYLEANVLPLYFTTMASFMILIMYGVYKTVVLKKKFGFKDFFFYIVSGALFFGNLALDLAAVLLVYLQVDAKVTTWEAVGAPVIVYCIMTSVGVWGTFVRAMNQVSIAFDITDQRENRIARAKVVDELTNFYTGMSVDGPIFICQIFIYIQVPSQTLMFTMLATVGMLGFCSQSYEKAQLLAGKIDLDWGEAQKMFLRGFICRRTGERIRAEDRTVVS